LIQEAPVEQIDNCPHLLVTLGKPVRLGLTRVFCRIAIITSDFLVHATGVGALAINVVAMARTCEKSLRIQSAIAGLAWALNNFLLGAYTAAALSLVSAGRTTTSVAVLRCAAQPRRAAFIGFASLTLGVAAATWDSRSLLITVAALLSTYAMFYMTGASLRWSMLVVSALWMDHAWSHGSWEQVAGNALTGLAALYGAWRVTDSQKPRLRIGLLSSRAAHRTRDQSLFPDAPVCKAYSEQPNFAAAATVKITRP
jgi:hypothetical protein